MKLNLGGIRHGSEERDGIKGPSIANQSQHGKFCGVCGAAMREREGKTLEGVPYKYRQCPGCGEKTVDMSRLREFIQSYRAVKTYNAKVTQWGQSLGIRIPKDIVKCHGLEKNQELKITPKGGGFVVMPINGSGSANEEKPVESRADSRKSFHKGDMEVAVRDEKTKKTESVQETAPTE